MHHHNCAATKYTTAVVCWFFRYKTQHVLLLQIEEQAERKKTTKICRMILPSAYVELLAYTYLA
jgi:hypothetical protein